MKQLSYQKYYSLCQFNYVRLSFNYVFLSFNYYISSCLLDIQLCSILSFNYYFLSINYPWSFSHLIMTVCHAISYFMLWTSLNYGLLRFNYSISIQYRLTACTWPRKSIADYWLTSWLLRAFLARGLKMASKEIQDVSDSDGKGKIINEH